MKRRTPLIVVLLLLALCGTAPGVTPPVQAQGGAPVVAAPRPSTPIVPLWESVQALQQASDPICAQRYAMLSSAGRPSNTARLVASRAAPQPAAAPQPVSDVYVVRPGDSISRIAAQFNTTVAAIATANAITNINVIYPGQRLTIPGATITPGAVAQVPAPFEFIWQEGEAVQGETLALWLRLPAGTRVVGQMGNQTIPFYNHCDLQWGLVAFDALDDLPGIYNLTLTAVAANGARTQATLPIVLYAGRFWSANIINYPADKQRLLERELILAERKQLNDLFATLPVSGPRWSAPFRQPLDSYITNSFGVRGMRDGKAVGYHEGIDFRARTGTPIPASAAGVVVVAQAMTVRGNTVFIDHGAGVITGYFHLSEILVQPGQQVNMGDLVGYSGGTGLATGPHLHWEMRVNGRWVNPASWVGRAVP